MKNGFISRALIISSSRFIALSLPLCDMVMLGHQGNEYVKNFSVAAQLSQIFVILSITLSIGINIVIGKCGQNLKQYIQGILRYSIYLALWLFIISLIISPLIHSNISVFLSYLILRAYPNRIIFQTIKLQAK